MSDFAPDDSILQHWNGQRLILVSSRHGIPFPPGEEVTINRGFLTVCQADPDPRKTEENCFFRRSVVLVGEPGSGVSRAVENMAGLNRKQDAWHPIVRISLKSRVVKLTPVPPGVERTEPEQHLYESWQALRALFGMKADTSVLPADVSTWQAHIRLPQILVELVERTFGEEEKRIRPAVILDDLVRYEHLPDLMSGFRHLEETGYLRHIRLLVVSSDERLLDTGPNSSLVPLCDIYRPPIWGADEVVLAWSQYYPNVAQRLDEHRVEACLKWTGGQPFLVRQYFDRLAKTWSDYPTVIEGVPSESHLPASLAGVSRSQAEQHAKRTGQALRRDPPQDYPARWQRTLATILLERVRLRKVLGALLAGEAVGLNEIKAEDLPMFLSGWIRWETGRKSWLIRSECHREWARKPLADPAGFLKSGGR